MKTLYLLRHAHSFAAIQPFMGDFERILSPQGIDEANAIGAFMQEHNFYPDFVLSSSSVRTIQTARYIFGKLLTRLGARISSNFDRGLYNASAERLMDEIRKIDDSIQHLLVVAHNPGIAELAERLGHEGFYSPGTMTVFRVDCAHWAELAPERAKFEREFVPDVQAA